MSQSAGPTYAIHPALGIARLGNAALDPNDPSTYYLGAESPFQVPNQGQSYKAAGKIKKQGQRFRIYEFENGIATREITLTEADVASIVWTVHLANRKPALDTSAALGTVSLPAAQPPECFTPAEAQPPTDGDVHYWPATTRNSSAPPDARAQLCIDPGPQSVGGSETRKDLSASVTLYTPALTPPATPVSTTVQLGTICVEAGSGRLLVFGGSGISEGLLNGQFSPNATLSDFGNNDGWYDDSSDGAVSATITFKNGTTVTLDQPDQRAWVICSPPRYTPYMNWVVTLLDIAQSYTPGVPAVTQPSFRNDVYPILRCVSLLQWLTARGSVGHGTGRGGYYLDPAKLALVSDNNKSPDSASFKARNAVLARVRNPNVPSPPLDTLQKFMPQVSADLTNNVGHFYDTAVVTPRQYSILQQWAAGNFVADGAPNPEFTPLESMPVAQQPAALDRGTLEATAGTPLYPGIESWRITRSPSLYADQPLRMAATTQPGDLSMGNALPWQADFLDCNDIWWPVHRPNEVTRDGTPMQSWVPDAWIPGGNAIYSDMVAGWWQLGFIVTEDNGATYVEVERNLPVAAGVGAPTLDVTKQPAGALGTT
jgi:hypothetical protein